MATSVPNAPTRRMDKNDRALVATHTWADQKFQLEDRVSLPDTKAVFLQGVVVYVGPVHFAEGTHVGIQLTGPSIGRGYCDGSYMGRKYFAGVGKNNGALAPIAKVSKRMAKPEEVRQSDLSRMEDLEFIDALVEARATTTLKLVEKKRSKGLGIFRKDEIHISKLKQRRMEEIMRAKMDQAPAKNKYSGPDSLLAPYDYELVEGLELTQQNFCMSDPTLPDNPITYASQSFLHMSGYSLNEILGRNCRFLQGKETDEYHVSRVRKSIMEGTDCHVCLLNYRKDGTSFYNRLFMTALRDTKGRIKNYLGVQCEVPTDVALEINNKEKVKFEAKMGKSPKQATKPLVSKIIMTQTPPKSIRKKEKTSCNISPRPMSASTAATDFSIESSESFEDKIEKVVNEIELDQMNFI